MFKTRRYEEEWMDSPGTSPVEFNRALRDIQWVNKHLKGAEVLVETLFQCLPESFSEQSVLDIGTGSADIPMALVKKARQHGKALRVTGVDVHPVAVETAQALTEHYPEIQIVQGDALALPYADQSFDWVISSMFMHHLTDREAILLLREMARLCRKGFIVNDLERHPLAYWSIKLLGMLTGKGRIFLNDAPLSVLRGFSHADLRSFCLRSQLESIQIKRKAPFRWVLTWTRPDVATSG